VSAVAFTLDLRIWLLAFGTFAIGTDVFVVPGILPTIASDLNVSLDSAGQLVSAYALTYALGSPVFAAATARIRRDRLVFCALLGFAAADMFCALSSSYMALLAARVAAGVAAALYTPTAYALATAAAPPGQKGAALSAVALGLTTSFVVGVPLGVMVGQTLGWHATFWFVATLSVVAAGALAWGRLSSEVEAEPQPGLLARLAPLGRRRVLHILGPGLLWSTASSTVYTYVASFMGHYGYGTGAIASLLSLFGLGALSGSQLGGRLADRFGPERPIAICLGLAVLNQALLPWTMEAAPAAGASMFIWSFCAWATWAPQQSRLIAVEPAGKTVVIALSSSVVYLASALGATLGGLLLPVLLVTRLPIVGAMLYALALLLFLVSCRTVPPPPVEA
jgi:predicted MFS family arabinose efflux permease